MKFLGVIIFILSFSRIVLGQDPYTEHFSLSNGLPSNSIYSILEDKDGFIWFTSNEGLYRYDGNHFKSYRAKNQTNFAGSGLMQDALGRIWHQNFDGSSFYVENDSLILLSQTSVSNFCPVMATNTTLFIQENGKIVALDLKTLKRLKEFKTAEFIYASQTIENTLYFIDNQTLYAIDERLKLEKVSDVPIKTSEFPFLIESNNTLYLTKKSSENNGIWKLENKQFSKIKSIPSTQLTQHSRTIGKYLYLLTSAGLNRYDVETMSFVDCIFESKNTTDVLIDRKGNYWITSSSDGLDIVPNVAIKHFQFDDLQPLKSLSYNNKLLVSSKNEKIAWFDPKTNSLDPVSIGNSNALPYYLYIDSVRNQLVYVQSDGYTYFTDLSNKKLIQKAILAIKRIIPFDPKYNAFVASGVIGFYCHKDDLKKTSIYDPHISHLERRIEGDLLFFRVPIAGRGKSVYLDKSTKQLYFITNSGTYIWNKGTISTTNFQDNSNGINELFKWNNQLMSLHVDGRIFSVNDGKKNTKSTNSILENLRNIKQIKCLNGRLYVRTSSKLLVYRKSFENETQLLSSFSLSNIECNDFSLIGKDLWILTSNGFIQWEIQPNNLQKSTGKFQLLSIEVNGEKIKTKTNLVFDFTQNNLTIDFAILDFGTPSISSIEYKINDQNWVIVDPNSRNLQFPALAPGSYVLKIRGKINGKYSNFEELKFTIKSPFWTTIWFYLLIFFLVSALIVWYFKKKIKSNRQRNELINEKIILESNLNKSLLASIKSQMNPHFIFNALNTIQAYIYMNDKDNASGYLSKFSKLTRSVLEMSEKEEIQLSEELNALTLYLDLEKMRFQEGFHYSILTINVDRDSVKIPSMLLQPYVENAIKHGLLHSNNKKILTIKIHKETSYLVVTIEDNGVGRKRSMELNQLRNQYHEGFSSQANEKRLNLLNANTEVSVVYSDNYDNFGQATGTIVQLKIKLKNELD